MKIILIAPCDTAFVFECESLVDNVPINPRLPEDFGCTPNQARPPRHLAWWNVPYIEVCMSHEPLFTQHWKGPARYDVRCLDGGAWDRPALWGAFGTLVEASRCAAAGPSWRQAEPAPHGTK